MSGPDASCEADPEVQQRESLVPREILEHPAIVRV